VSESSRSSGLVPAKFGTTGSNSSTEPARDSERANVGEQATIVKPDDFVGCLVPPLRFGDGTKIRSDDHVKKIRIEMEMEIRIRCAAASVVRS
jgi:hypothetical protein